MNDEAVRLCKKEVKAYFKLRAQHLLERTEENYRLSSYIK
jgi:hypothetical protein